MALAIPTELFRDGAIYEGEMTIVQANEYSRDGIRYTVYLFLIHRNWRFCLRRNIIRKPKIFLLTFNLYVPFQVWKLLTFILQTL